MSDTCYKLGGGETRGFWLTVCFNKSVTRPVDIDLNGGRTTMIITKRGVCFSSTMIRIRRHGDEPRDNALMKRGNAAVASRYTATKLRVKKLRSYNMYICTCALGVMDVRASLKLEHQPRVGCARIGF